MKRKGESMCLELVTERRDPNDDMVVGYKAFELALGKLYGEFREKHYKREIGRHYVATDDIIRSYHGYNYDSGFHAFTSFEGADKWVRPNEGCLIVFEVHLWDIRAVGVQDGSKCVVAKNMRIIGEVTE
jgi:hypothetical protein